MQFGPIAIPGEYLLIALAALLVVISLIANQRRRQQFAADNARIDMEAAARGWAHSGELSGSRQTHRFSGKTHGVAWEIESAISTSRDSGQAGRFTRWRTEQVTLTGEAALIFPKMHNTIQLGEASAQSVKGNPLARMAFRFFLERVIQVNASDIAELDTLQRVEAGSDRLRESYSVLATSESAASGLLDDDAESALIGWATGDDESAVGSVIAILFWKGGLHIVFNEAVFEPSQLESVIRLGAALASK